MIIENLNEQNINHLKSELKNMMKENSDMNYQIFDQRTLDNLKETADSYNLLRKEIEKLRLKLINIFGDNVLINGKFVDITKNNHTRFKG